MRMSTKGRYGLRLMMELASGYGRGPMLADAIAKNQTISSKYIHLLANGLRAAGLLRAVRGPSGGYELARAPSAITALEVIEALEGPNAPLECVEDATSCDRASGCAARDLWCDVAIAMDKVLSGITLEQLVARQRAKLNTCANYEI
jgi:Rrf2 family cysteine metabolism transcriptional repressor